MSPRLQEIDVAGFTGQFDDVKYWLGVLRSPTDPTSGLLFDLEALADGQVPSAYLNSSSGAKIVPGPDLPKRIRLAYAIQAFWDQTGDDTAIRRDSVEDWVDVDRVEAYRSLEVKLKDQVEAVGKQLASSMLGVRFKEAVQVYTPMQFMECVLDILPVLVQTGQLANAIKWNTPLFAGARLTQVFDLFELNVPVGGSANDVSPLLNIRSAADGSVKWGATEIKQRSQAEELKADVVAPKKLVETYKLYREHVIPALIVSHLERKTSYSAFTDEIDDLVKRSTLPFYPGGALDVDPNQSLIDFKAQVLQADTTRGPTYYSYFATELDRVASSTESVLGVIDLYLAVKKIASAPELTATDLKDLIVAGLGFVDDGLSRLAPASAALEAEVGAATSRLSTTFARKMIARALFVFALYDVFVHTKAVSNSTTDAEVVGNSLKLAGAVVGVGASGIGMLAQAGVISVAAAPVVITGLVAAALGLIGWGVIALFHESYPEQILRGCFFRKDTDDRQTALEADNEAVDLRTGFVKSVGGSVQEDLGLQIAYAVGLTRGFAPSAENLTLGDIRKVKYSIARTPNSSNPPSSNADVAFASSISVVNLDFDDNGGAQSGHRENEIEKALFEDFEIPYTSVELDGMEPPLEFEIRTSFRDEPLTFEPLRRGTLRWLAENVVAAGGNAPTWKPGAKENLRIRERAKAS